MLSLQSGNKAAAAVPVLAVASGLEEDSDLVPAGRYKGSQQGAVSTAVPGSAAEGGEAVVCFRAFLSVSEQRKLTV